MLVRLVLLTEALVLPLVVGMDMVLLIMKSMMVRSMLALILFRLSNLVVVTEAAHLVAECQSRPKLPNYTP